MWSPRSRVIGSKTVEVQIAADESAEVRVVVDAGATHQTPKTAACSMIDRAICLTALLLVRP